MRGVLPAVGLAVLLWAPAAMAWPVDVYLDLSPGQERIERLTAVSWVEVEDPAVAVAEVLPAGELMVTGLGKGRTLLLLYAEGRFAVWRVRVGEAPLENPGALAAARKACPGLKADKDGLFAKVGDDRCRLALRRALEADTYRARDLELVFELTALQAQLGDLEEGLGAAKLGKVGARYWGAGLRLEGKVSGEEQKRALWTVFRRSLGRVALEDRLELTDEKKEEGSEEP